jgi:threonine dehydratase
MILPGYNDVLAAAERLRPHIHRTPVLTSKSLDEITGSSLFFKCENFQKAGSFKIRGATNAIMQLPERDKKAGVATHSSGNFAQALSLAARNSGLRAYIVMPENAPQVKRSAVKAYGAEIIYCAPNLQARESTLNEVVERTGACFVHPYNDFDVILGHATAALELVQESGSMDIVIAPVGGGGLLSGTALAIHYILPDALIYGGEPFNADDAYHSLHEKKIIPCKNPETIADGLRTSLGDKTFTVISQLVSDIIRVTEEEIIQSMKLIWERMKIIIEPSSAVAFAAVIKEKENFTGKKIGIILSGGNIDLTNLPFKL